MQIDDNLIRRLTIENVPGELKDEDFDDPEYVRWVSEHALTIDDLNEMFKKAMA